MTTRTLSRPAPAPLPDPALDDALSHIGDLSERLWAVRRLHAPTRVRTLFGERVVCPACGRPSPCPTLQAVAPRR